MISSGNNGMTEQENRYQQAMYYLANACWHEGLGDQALKALSDMLDRARVANEPTRYLPIIDDPALVRPYIKF